MSTATSQTTSADNITTDRMFEILTGQLKQKPEGQKKIMAHLRAITGRSVALPVYHNDATISDETKRDTYQSCVKALLNNNYSELQGQSKIPGEQREQRIDPVEQAQSVTKTAAQSTTTKPPESTELPPEARNPTLGDKTVNILAHSTSTESGLVSSILAALEPGIIAIVDRRIQEAAQPTVTEVLKKLNNGSFPENRVKDIVSQVLRERFAA